MSPMNATSDYQRFASSIAMNASTPPNTRVSDDGMHITYGEKTLSIAKWRGGLRRLADEATKELDDLCMHNLFGLCIPDNVFDDWANEDRGYSWTKNGNFTEDRRSLLAAMLRDPTKQLAKLNDAGVFQFNIAEVWDFLHKCDSVNEKLALLSFFTAGQTPRVAEFVQHKFANSTRPRTVLRDYQSIWLATRRVKSENLIEKETFIPMKCHPELTKLLERYLLIVRPIEAELVKVVRSAKHYHNFTEFLWTKNCEPLSPEAMRKTILLFTTEYFGVSIGTQEYRQICVEIGRVFLGSEFEIRQEDMDALASQAGHSIDMSCLRYAPEVGKIPSMSSDLLGRFGRVSEAWWQVAGFRPGYTPTLPLRVRQDLHAAAHTAPIQPGPALAQAPIIDTQAIILAMTSAVTAEIQKVEVSLEALVRRTVAEAMIQAQYPQVRRSNVLPPQALPVPVIEDDHMDNVRCAEYSMPISATAVDQGFMDDIYGDEPAAKHTYAEDNSILTKHHTSLVAPGKGVTSQMLDALLALQFPSIPKPTFKSSQQAQAVQLAVEHQQSFVAVLPTGGGKSLTYTLPAFNQKEVGYRSYIIVPNRALLQDQMERSKAIGLDVVLWTARKPVVEEGKQLVFLAMESATSPSFKRYACFYFKLNLTSVTDTGLVMVVKFSAWFWMRPIKFLAMLSFVHSFRSFTNLQNSRFN